MANFWWNPSSANPNSANGPVVLSEAQWRLQMGFWIDNVDLLESQLLGAVGVQWFRAPDGDYWVDANAVAPPAFTPPSSNAANANMNVTDNSSYQSIAP